MELLKSEDGRPRVDGFSSVVLIYPYKNPSFIYLDHKDKGYPNFPNRLCPIGGNIKATDLGPKELVWREANEEIVILDEVVKKVSADESRQQLDSPEAKDYEVSRKDVTVTDNDRSLLASLKSYVWKSLSPLGDYWQIVPTEVFKRLANKDRPTVQAICSYWRAPLDDGVWTNLLRLKAKFGKLSNESFDRVVSLQQIVDQKIECAWGHDQVLQRHFTDYGLAEALAMPIIDGIVMDEIGLPMRTFAEYRQLYDFKMKL